MFVPLSLGWRMHALSLTSANKLRATYIPNLHGLYDKPPSFSRQLHLLGWAVYIPSENFFEYLICMIGILQNLELVYCFKLFF